MNTANIDAFRSDFPGDVILPGDSGYDEARTVMVRQGSPALIVRPRSSEGVAQAVRYAKDNSLKLSVRSGGHSNAGHSTNDGGMIIDLKHLNSVEVRDAATRRVRLGGGATWGEVVKVLSGHGLALTSGDVSSVGVGGLVVGGGVGWMVRKYGLAIDNLVAAEVVTVSGEIIRASTSEHADLFWAIRGGGGNFGVVTGFEFAAQPVSKVHFGSITFKPDSFADILKGWVDYMRTAPEELTTMLLALPTFAGNPPAIIIMCCYASEDATAANAAIDPLRKLGEAVSDDVTLEDYADVLEEAHPYEGVRIITHNTLVRTVSDELISTVEEAYRRHDAILQIRSIGGAMNRVAGDDTAFAHRDSEIMIISPVFLPPNASESDVDDALAPWRAIAAFGSGAYVNFFSENTGQEILAAYPPATLARLASIKQKYDPQNLFSQNYNITPSSATAKTESAASALTS